MVYDDYTWRQKILGGGNKTENCAWRIFTKSVFLDQG